MALLVYLIPLTVIIYSVQSQLRWEQLHNGTGVAPPARMYMGFGYDPVTDKIIVFGGNPGPMNDTWIYDVLQGRWKELTVTKSPEARYGMVTGVSNGYFYVTTGEGKNKKFFNDVWRLDLRTEQWDQLPAHRRPDFYSPEEWESRKDNIRLPRPRYGAIGGIYNNGGDALYISMGFDAQRMTHTYSYSIPNQRWKLENCKGCNSYNPSYPHARCLHAGTMIDKDEFVIFGGCLGGGGTGGPCPSGDSWRFNGRSKTWKRLPECAAPRMFGGMASLPSSDNKRRVILYGGVDTSDAVIRTDGIKADQVAVFDPDTDDWTLRKTLPMNGSDLMPTKRAMVGFATAKNGIYMFGGSSSKPMNDLWILRGSVMDADQSEAVPCTSHFVDYITVHGILMVIGWGVFLQWGAFIARYFKFKDPAWFHLHRGFQVFGLACAIAGLVMGILSVPFDHLKFSHAIIGVIVMILGVLQPFNALCRPHKPENGKEKSSRRRLWEFIHHFGGRLALVLALLNISLGVFLSVTARHIWIIWFAYLGFLVLSYVVVEFFRSLRGRRAGPIKYGKDELYLEGIDKH